MPRKQKLKVFRTPAGFYDAYVAAPSQKAALEAWGSERDLFTRGIAEQVIDEALMREPLDNPGQIIRRSRGTAAEQLAAVPTEQRRTRPAMPKPALRNSRSLDNTKPIAGKRKAKSAPPAKPKLQKKSKPRPRPDGAPRDEARNALEAATKHYRDNRAALKRRADQLAREEAALDRAERADVSKLTRNLDRAEAAYNRQMRAWKER